MTTMRMRALARSRANGRGGVRVIGAIGVLVAAAMLSACSGQPGAAAVVDGRVISVDDVQTATADLAPVYSGVTPSAVLAVLVQAPLLTEFAADHGVGVSTDDALAALTELSTPSASGADHEFSAPAVAVQRYLLESEAVQALADAEGGFPDLQQAIASQQVEVSSRFGAVDEAGVVIEAVHPWLVPPPAA